MSEPIDVVRRLVDEVMNGGDLDVLDELCIPSLAPKLRRAFREHSADRDEEHPSKQPRSTTGR